MGVTAPEVTERADAKDFEASPRIEGIREPLTYEARVERTRRGGIRIRSVGEPRSYFQDVVALERSGDRAARERLERHGREVEGEMRARRVAESPEVRYELETRAPTASFAAPPLWLIDYFATADRAERVLADLAPNFFLPQGVFSVNLPGETQASSVGEQQLGTSVPSTDATDQAISSAVATLAGQWDVPLQMLEQSPPSAAFDWVAFTQLQADYDAQLEYQLINGNSPGIVGLLNNPLVPAANVITTTQTTATGQFPALGQVLAAVGNTRLMPAEAWLIRTNRFAWYGSSEDLASRPLMITDRDGSGMFSMLGVNANHDNAVPITLGAGRNQDVVIACRPSDWLVLESDLTTDVMEDVLSGSLNVRLQLRGYIAALLRQPNSVAYLTGSGMVRPSGF
jgi:hypothetical protein